MEHKRNRGVRVGPSGSASLDVPEIKSRLMPGVDQIHVAGGSTTRQQQLHPGRIRVMLSSNRTRRCVLRCHPDYCGRPWLELRGRQQWSDRDDSRGALPGRWRADENRAEQETAEKRHDDQTRFLEVEFHTGGDLIVAERPQARPTLPWSGLVGRAAHGASIIFPIRISSRRLLASSSHLACTKVYQGKPW